MAKRKTSGGKSPTKQNSSDSGRDKKRAECAADKFLIVGMGASAGGLEAFKEFFTAMPASPDMAFVLVQDLDPTHKSPMVKLLKNHTSMAVTEVADNTKVVKNHVYIIPPNRDMAIFEGVLHLKEPSGARGFRKPIDFFLRSLAEDQQERAVGIILSGTGTEGTLSLKEIKGHRGLSLVQDSGRAEDEDLAQSSIFTGTDDFLLSIAEMPDMLINYSNHRKFRHRAKVEARAKKTRLLEQELGSEKARALLQELEVHQIELETQNDELREAQLRLQNSRDEYSDLFDFAPVGYLILDEKGTIVNINLTGCHLLGTERASSIGSLFFAYMSADVAHMFYLKLKEAFKLGELRAIDLQIDPTDKPSLTVLVQGAVTTKETEGKPLCRLSVQDVTELRQAEALLLQRQREKLQEEKARIQRYFDLAPVVFLLIDPELNIEIINQKGCDLLGYDRVQVQGKNWFENFIAPLDEDGVESSDIEFCRKKMLLQPYAECYIIRKNGEQRLIAWTNSTVLDKQGNIIGTISAGEDITDRSKEDTEKKGFVKQLEATVEARTKTLKQLEREKKDREKDNRFLTGASRELRARLTRVLVSANRIEKYNGPGQSSKQLPHIADVRAEVEQLSFMLDNYLSMDRLERGKIKIHKASVDLKDLVGSITEDMEGLLKNGQQINYRHNGTMEIVTDRKILHNTLTNLITNAIKYSDVDVSVKTLVDDGLLIASIKDWGIAIPMEEQQQVFTKYYRAKNAAKVKGTGLGLSNAKRYVELLGGSLEFTSKPETGSTFTLILPLT